MSTDFFHKSFRTLVNIPANAVATDNLLGIAYEWGEHLAAQRRSNFSTESVKKRFLEDIYNPAIRVRALEGALDYVNGFTVFVSRNGALPPEQTEALYYNLLLCHARHIQKPSEQTAEAVGHSYAKVQQARHPSTNETLLSVEDEKLFIAPLKQKYGRALNEGIKGATAPSGRVLGGQSFIKSLFCGSWLQEIYQKAQSLFR